MKRVLHSNATVKNGLVAVQAATKTGEVIDRFNFRDAIVHGLVTNVTGTPTATEVTFKVQHSDTDVTGDFKDAVIQGHATSVVINSEGELHLNLDGFKQYIRIVATANFTGGTSPKADLVATVVLGNPVTMPGRTALN